MPAQLVALNDGPSILLDKPILMLGRHPECDIQIDSRKISRRHCCIAKVSDYLVVRDLGSTNGVRINGIRVVEGRLNTGDELTIGNHRYRVTWESDEPPPPRRATPAAKPVAAPQKPPPRQTVIDELLESSDESIPLPEPGLSHLGMPQPKPVVKPVAKPPARPPAREEASMILPDHLDLLPSDSFPGVSSSPSHHGH